MEIYTPSQNIVRRSNRISIVLLLTFLLAPLAVWAQESGCCECEKMVWNIKVTLMDGWAPVQSIDYKTFVGKIELKDKDLDDVEFPDHSKLKQYTFDEGGLVIKLDHDKIKRESGLGGTHRISETEMTLYIDATIDKNQMWYKETSKCDAPVENVGLKNAEVDFKLINLKEETSHSAGTESRPTYKLEKIKKYRHRGGYDIINRDLGSATWILKPMLNLESTSADCYSAHCFMPLRVTFIWGDDENAGAIEKLGTQVMPQEDLIVTAYGTNKTIDDVLTFHITNPKEQTIAYHWGQMLVPSDGKYQGYTIIDEISGEVEPGQTVIDTAIGGCTSIRYKPLPDGVKSVPESEWISKLEAGPPPQPGFTPGEGSAFVPITIKEGEPYCTFIGREEPFPFTIDYIEHPDEAASSLIASFENIITAYDSLYEAGEINTPFSSDPIKERETSTIQASWKYNSIFGGDPYTYDEFEVKLIEQYEDITNTKYEDAPQETKDQLQSGGKEFWTVFDLVDEAAKVLKTDDPSTTINQQDFRGYCNVPGLGVLNVLDESICDAMGGTFFTKEEDANAYDKPQRDTFPVSLKKLTTSLGKGGQITIGGAVSGETGNISRIIIRVTNEIETEVKVKVDPVTREFKVVIPGIHEGTYKIAVEVVMTGEAASYGLVHGRIIIVSDEETTNKGSIISINGQTVKIVEIDEDGNVIVEFAGNQHTLKTGESLNAERGIITLSEVDQENDEVTFEIKKKKCCTGEDTPDEIEEDLSDYQNPKELTAEQKEKLGLSGYKGVIFPPHIAKDKPETVIAIIPFTSLPPYGFRCLSHSWLFNEQASNYIKNQTPILESLQTFAIKDANIHNKNNTDSADSSKVLIIERLQLDKIFEIWTLPKDRYNEQVVRGNLANPDYIIDGVFGFICCPLSEDREGVRPYFEAFIVNAKDETGENELDRVGYMSPNCYDPNDPDIWKKIDKDALKFQHQVRNMVKKFINHF